MNYQKICEVIRFGKKNTARQKRIHSIHERHMLNLYTHLPHRGDMKNGMLYKHKDTNGKMYYSRYLITLGSYSRFFTNTRECEGIRIYLSNHLNKPYEVKVEPISYWSYGHCNKKDIVNIFLGKETAEAFRKNEIYLSNRYFIIKDKGDFKLLTIDINHHKKQELTVKELKAYWYGEAGEQKAFGENIDKAMHNYFISKLNTGGNNEC